MTNENYGAKLSKAREKDRLTPDDPIWRTEYVYVVIELLGGLAPTIVPAAAPFNIETDWFAIRDEFEFRHQADAYRDFLSAIEPNGRFVIRREVRELSVGPDGTESRQPRDLPGPPPRVGR
jgi:hypothetical protein